MKRSLTFLNGNRSGESLALAVDSDLILIGRSSKAVIRLEDPRASRSHLELRLRNGATSARNLSSHGFLLNNRMCSGADEVPLADGDVLMLGETQIRYEESRDRGVSDPADERGACEGVVDETRALDECTDVPIGRLSDRDDGDSGDDGTRVIEGVREGPILTGKDLPAWRPPDANGASGSWRVRLLLGLLVISGVGGVCLAQQRNARQRAATERQEYRDDVAGKFSLRLPVRWNLVESGPDGVRWADAGGENSQASIKTLVEKNPLHADFGLSFGFTRYLREAEKGHPGFQLIGKKPLNVNGAETLHYGFRMPGKEGLGLFVLDGETRLVIEGVVPAERAAELKPRVIEVLESFRLLTGRPQQYVDFPIPDAEMKRAALASVAETEERILQLTDRGGDLFNQRSVKRDNLHLALEAYRRALQWHLALEGDSPSQRFTGLVRKLRIVTVAFQEAVRDEVFALRQARGLGNRSGMQSAALKIVQMDPDRTHPENIEAQAALRSMKAQDKRIR